jgi:very-short-patch-repair endonuclease
MKATPDIIKNAARTLRKNMTPAEIILWDWLRAKRFFWKKILRQSPLYVFTENTWLDRYIIPDFTCHSSKFIIELDGGVHDNIDIFTLDKEKEILVKNLWFSIIRFKNKEIFTNIENVLKKINTLCS